MFLPVSPLIPTSSFINFGDFLLTSPFIGPSLFIILTKICQSSRLFHPPILFETREYLFVVVKLWNKLALITKATVCLFKLNIIIITFMKTSAFSVMISADIFTVFLRCSYQFVTRYRQIWRLKDISRWSYVLRDCIYQNIHHLLSYISYEWGLSSWVWDIYKDIYNFIVIYIISRSSYILWEGQLCGRRVDGVIWSWCRGTGHRVMKALRERLCLSNKFITDLWSLGWSKDMLKKLRNFFEQQSVAG